MFRFSDKDQAIVSSKFLKDLRKELNDPDFADAVLVCQGEEIPCHRVFLAARSDVFKKMFLQKSFIEGNLKVWSLMLERTNSRGVAKNIKGVGP